MGYSQTLAIFVFSTHFLFSFISFISLIQIFKKICATCFSICLYTVYYFTIILVVMKGLKSYNELVKSRCFYTISYTKIKSFKSIYPICIFFIVVIMFCIGCIALCNKSPFLNFSRNLPLLLFFSFLILGILLSCLKSIVLGISLVIASMVINSQFCIA